MTVSEIPQMGYCYMACYPQVPSVDAVRHVWGRLMNMRLAENERENFELACAESESYATNAEAAVIHIVELYSGFGLMRSEENRRRYAIPNDSVIVGTLKAMCASLMRSVLPDDDYQEFVRALAMCTAEQRVRKLGSRESRIQEPARLEEWEVEALMRVVENGHRVAWGGGGGPDLYMSVDSNAKWDRHAVEKLMCAFQRRAHGNLQAS